MLQLLSQSDQSTLGVKISGNLTADDYRLFANEIALRTQDNDAISVLIEIENFEGVSPQAMLEDLKMVEHTKDLDRAAFVTEGGWWEGATQMIGQPLGDLMDIDVKHFKPSDITTAWNWVQN